MKKFRYNFFWKNIIAGETKISVHTNLSTRTIKFKHTFSIRIYPSLTHQQFNIANEITHNAISLDISINQNFHRGKINSVSKCSVRGKEFGGRGSILWIKSFERGVMQRMLFPFYANDILEASLDFGE